ncbi:MAG TPA: phosphoglycerate dehydrogenase [Gemmataceae bacterium]|jgi:phosphoglycerate dehydrogenase-like enzyme|nr:phosphoglycerate dehydrogenase [Gemmataceae bacterium]
MTKDKPKVLVTPTTLAGIDGPFLEVLRAGGLRIVYPPRTAQLTESELLEDLPGISATLAGSEPYTRRVVESAPGLRVIARAGVGYDAVDVAAATDHGIAVTTTPGTNQDTVAEHTFALILALAKDVVAADRSVRTGGWRREPSLPLRGRTLGIAGLGRIGKAVALRGASFGMPLLAYEPFPDEAFVKQVGVTLVPLEQLLAESDYLSLHMPLTPESRHLINRRTLALMKPTALLINTARGGLVCEPDLLEALRARRIAGAALDVFEKEPPGANALFELDNVVLTPHTAGVDLQSRDDMALHAARAIVALYQGEWPVHQVVNPEVRERFRW